MCGYILKQPLQKRGSNSIIKGLENFLLFGFLTLANPMVFLESSRFLFLGNTQETNVLTFLQIAGSGFIINYSLNILFLLGSEFLTVVFPSYKITTITKNIELGIRIVSISLLLYTFGRYPWRSSHTFFFTPKNLYKPQPRKVGKSLSRLMPYRKVKLYMLKKRQTNPWTTVKQNRKTGLKFEKKREELQSIYPIVNSQIYNIYADNPARMDPSRILHQNSRANKPLWLNGFVRVLYLYDRQGQSDNSQLESKNKNINEGRSYASEKFYKAKTHAGFLKFSYVLPEIKTKTSSLNAEFLQASMTRPEKYLSSFPTTMYYPTQK